MHDGSLGVAVGGELKIAIVEEDPFEDGRRAVLNLGHTFAYAIEHVTGGRVDHGEAGGIGLAAPALADHVESLLARVGLAADLPAPIPPAALLDAMRRDKKRQGRRLRFVLLRDVGDAILTDTVAPDDLVAVLDSLNP